MTYTFNFDWFSKSMPELSKYLVHLPGTSCQLLEIGSYEGRSALWMAETLMAHPDARLTCVDPWVGEGVYNGETNFRLNIADCPRRDQIRAIKGPSSVILPTLDPESRFDFIYIDGSHDARDVISDWVHVQPYVKSGAVICFDDYEWRDHYDTVLFEPKPAIDAIVKFWGDELELLHQGYQVFVKIK